MSFSLYSLENEGAFSCSVIHQNVKDLKDGKVEFFNGFTDKVNEGDTLTVRYFERNNSLMIRVFDPLRDEEFTRFDLFTDSLYDNIYPEPRGLMFRQQSYQEFRVLNPMPFSSSHIRLKNQFGDLELQRYDKRLWHGFYRSDPKPHFEVESTSFLMHDILLKCNHVVDNIKNIINSQFKKLEVIRQE